MVAEPDEVAKFGLWGLSDTEGTVILIFKIV